MAALTAESEISLEAVELEMALQLQEVVVNGFVDHVQDAVETAGYRFLFQLPATGEDGTQRIAAICAGAGESRRILLIHLEDDGHSVRVEPAGSNDNAFAEVAQSFAEVMEELDRM